MDKNDIKQLLDQQTKELHGDYDRQGKFLLDEFKHQASIIAEQYGSLNKKVDKIDSKLDATFEEVGHLLENMDFVKDELRLIRNELKEKVGRDEFIALEKRVIFLEKKPRLT